MRREKMAETECGRKLWTAWIFALCVCFLTGCGKGKEADWKETETAEVLLPVTFRVEPVTNQSDNQQFVEEFNREFEGQYQMEVQWLTESSSGYRNKLKQWNVLDEMPALITDAGFDYDFYRILVENKRLVDLRPWMEASDFWMEAMNADILEDCMEEDGCIYLSPLGSSVHSYAGIIYNEEMLRSVGYDTFPQTWDDLFDCMDALKEKGITPLALHGSGSYWVPMLFGSAYLMNSEEGKAFLMQGFPESYQEDCVKEMLEMVKRLYDYTFEDALELDYDDIAVRFCNEEAAMIANGKWMFDIMSEKNKERLRFSSFPGGVMMNAPRMSAWAAPVGYSEEVTEGAIKALEFRIHLEQRDAEALLNGTPENPLMASYIEAVKTVRTVMPNYQLQWEQELQNEFFTANMPGFLNGEYTAEKFISMMDEKVRQIQSKK